ncbi:unnamed protein product [Triticum turgidum subsp. durum]|uniref:Cytochrome P450 n=1 Tax=Triticum turgidum subsp. durum TaxID=4567 RepID=A0A9R0QWB5_TRITD|nr:unnamed protein product [Triticum turgidum subsp. durum]
METWQIFFGVILFALPLTLLLLRTGKTGGGARRPIPPGPPSFPVLGSMVWLTNSPADGELLLRRLFARYGPIVSLRVGSRLSIFVADRRLAHAALWPTARPSRPSGSWARMTTPSRAPATGPCGASSAATSSPRRCTRPASDSSRPRAPGYAACSSTSCGTSRPPAGRPLWRRSSTPCSASSCSCPSASGSTSPRCARSPPRSATSCSTSPRKWLSSPSSRRSQSTSFVTASRPRTPCGGGRRTTSTGLQWIMAELVKNRSIQEKLYEEIKDTTGDDQEEVSGDDIHKMPYLKAVVLEGLRKHPPGHFVLPHKAAEDMEIGGYLIPKGATVNFMVAEMGRNEREWEKPLEFSPDRFLQGGAGEAVDVTGNREIKMMPFGVGRRICAGLGIAMLHLEYFVANMVREFKWQEVAGEEVDFAEKNEFTVVMKKPLRSRLVPRRS